MRHWSYKKKVNQLEGQSRDQYPECTASTFGGDPFPGQAKECWCEAKPIHYPHKCATEGEDCLCSGDVYFMSNNIDGKASPHYIEAVNQNYTINTMNQTKSISCVASSFENVDPLVGVQKQCMCDNDQTVTTRENIQTIKDSWRQRKLLADLLNTLNTAESQLKNDTEAADASSNAVDAIDNSTHSENTLEKA